MNYFKTKTQCGCINQITKRKSWIERQKGGSCWHLASLAAHPTPLWGKENSRRLNLTMKTNPQLAADCPLFLGQCTCTKSSLNKVLKRILLEHLSLVYVLWTLTFKAMVLSFILCQFPQTYLLMLLRDWMRIPDQRRSTNVYFIPQNV
jgi:hypothetical protein